MVILWYCFCAFHTPDSFQKGMDALSAFQAEEALALLTHAREKGVYQYENLVRLVQHLGIAYTYLDERDQALNVFDYLLALDPAHALSYTLSPKVTFLFEQARKIAAKRLPPTVYLGWPRGLRVQDPVPVEVEVVADPLEFLKMGKLHYRTKGQKNFSTIEFPFPKAGSYQRIVIPPLSRDIQASETYQVYLTGYDQRGNQVFRHGFQQPREIPLEYVTPEPWYRKWWIWAILGSVVATGTGTTVYLMTRSPPSTVSGQFQVP